MFIDTNAILVIDGKEYPNNWVEVVRPDFFRIFPDERKLKFDISEMAYSAKANSLGCPDIIEYECQAKNTNGHIMNFILRIHNKRGKIEVVHG